MTQNPKGTGKDLNIEINVGKIALERQARKFNLGAVA